MIDWNDNITDEMLAAYIDGNADANECSLIEQEISGDSLLSEAVDIVSDINAFEQGTYPTLLPTLDNIWSSGIDAMLSNPLMENDMQNPSSCNLSQCDLFDQGCGGLHIEDDNDMNNMFNNNIEE